MDLFLSSSKYLQYWCYLVVLVLLLPGRAAAAGQCRFDAMFIFGDSNSDTGAYSAAFPPTYPPNGETYPGGPAGRYSDGRLIVDFLANALGMPFPSPYLQSLESDFSHGANFAVFSAGVLRGQLEGGSPFLLQVQVNQFLRFKQSVESLNSSGTPVPAPDVFGRALYFIYIGQNDFTANWTSPAAVDYEKVASQIAETVKKLYAQGGRTFFVLNLAPVGCYPFILNSGAANATDRDSYGCLPACNNAVDSYNAILSAKISQARQDLQPNADVILVNTHAILLKLFQNPAFYEITNATAPCVAFGADGTVLSTCPDPKSYANWDGTHLTEKANRVVADAVLTGAYFEPPFPIGNPCV